MTNLTRKELQDALNVLWKLSEDIQLNVCTPAYSETIVPMIGELRTCDALDAAAKLIHSVLDGIAEEGEADAHLITITKEDDLERIEVLDGKARKNSIYGQMIRTAPRDMYLCLYAVEDLLHRLCVMYEEADGSEEQLQNLKNRIGEYRNLKLRLRSQIEEYEKP